LKPVIARLARHVTVGALLALAALAAAGLALGGAAGPYPDGPPRRTRGLALPGVAAALHRRAVAAAAS